MTKSVKDKIWEKALSKIAVRPQSKNELRQKLKEAFPEEDHLIESTLTEMENLQLISDRNFTEQFLAHLTQKAIGRLKIMVETRKKGLDPDLVDTMLLNMEWSEEESCKRAYEEKMRTLREEDPVKRKRKLLSFLRNRGFKDTVIYKFLK